MTTLAAGESCGTVDLIVHLVRPVTPASGPFVAEGRIVHRGERIATADSRLAHAGGALAARYDHLRDRSAHDAIMTKRRPTPTGSHATLLA